MMATSAPSPKWERKAGEDPTYILLGMMATSAPSPKWEKKAGEDPTDGGF
jgi:hypothetical protein